MTIPFTETQETFDTTGIRESLSDLIYDLSPTETPFLMMAGRGTAQNLKEEWQIDMLASAGHNAREQGHKVVDASINGVDPTYRIANYQQISDKHISITGTVEVVNKAGRMSELSYQLAKRSKELKRDIEFCCVGEDNTAVVPDTAVAGEVASVSAFFNANLAGTFAASLLDGTHISRGAGGTDGGWNGTIHAAPGAGTARGLLESHVQDVIQGAWQNGGDPTVLMCGPFNKRVMSGFTGYSTRQDRGEDKRLVAALDVYVSDYGEHRMVPNRFQLADTVYAFTPELWEICYLRPFRQHALAKIGDTEERTLLAEWTLKGLNHSGNGIIQDLSTS